MPFDASTLEVFVASTNDLQEERNAVEEVLREWNSSNGKVRQIMLKSIRWEKDATPELGSGSAQEVVNKRLLGSADILIGVIGRRLGTPTETSISGTVEEIERFADAKKPVLLYFSDRQFSLADIDPKELDGVRNFRQSLQKRGLYATFKDIADLKEKVRNHLETRLADFAPLLIPAGRALAYGYFKNFVLPTHQILRGRQVNLPDYKIDGKDGEGQRGDGPNLSFSEFRILIVKPALLEEATDDAVFQLRSKSLEEINVKIPQNRRAFRVYVRKTTKALLEKAIRENAEQGLQIESLDVIDFPTPMIALQDFIDYQEQSLLKENPDPSALNYWKQQKTIQYEKFFEQLDSRIRRERIQSVTYLNGFELPN